MAKIKQKFVPEVAEQFVPLKRRMADFSPLSRAAAAEGAAAASVGKAFQGLGAAFARAQAKATAVAQTQWDVEYYNLIGEVEDELRRAARQAPEGGFGLSERIGDVWKRKTEEFLARAPKQLRGEYAVKLARYQRQLERAAFKVEETLHDNKLKRNIEEIVRKHQSTVEAAPEKLKEVEAQASNYISSLPIPEDTKATLLSAAKSSLQASAAAGRILKIYTDEPLKKSYRDLGGIDGILQRIHEVEGTGKSKTSSAAGHFQVTRGTWLRLVRKYYPDMVKRMSERELLNLRYNKEFAWDITRKLTLENIQALMSAGIDPTPGRIRLAHFAGPSGAIKVILSDDNTPLESILPSNYFKANSFLKGKTAGWLKRWADKQMGTAGSSPTSLFSDLDHLTPEQRLSFVRQAFAATRFRENEFVNDVLTQIASGQIESPKSYIRDLLKTGQIDGSAYIRLSEAVERLDGLETSPILQSYLKSMREDGMDGAWKDAVKDFESGAISASVFKRIKEEYTLLKSLKDKEAAQGILERALKGEASVDDVDKLDLSPEVKIKMKKYIQTAQSLNNAAEAMRLADSIVKGELDREDFRQRYLKGEVSTDLFTKTMRYVNSIETGMKLSSEESLKIFQQALTEASDPNNHKSIADLTSQLIEQLGGQFTVGMMKKIAKAYQEKVAAREYADANMLTSHDSDGKRAADLWLERSGLEKILLSPNRAQVLGAIQQKIAPLAQAGKPLPPKLGGILKAKLYSDNEIEVGTALDSFAQLHAVNPKAVQQLLGDEDFNTFYILTTMRAYGMPMTQITNIRDEMRSPSDFLSGAKKVFSEVSTGFFSKATSVAKYLREFVDDNDLDVSPDQWNMLEQEYTTYFAVGYRIFGDAAKAKTLADRLIKSYWGKTEIEGIDMLATRIPPHLVAPNEGILKAWVNGPLQEAVGKLKEQASGDVLSVYLTSDRGSVQGFLSGAENVQIKYKIGALVETPDGYIKFQELDEPVVFDIGKVSKTIYERIRKDRAKWREGNFWGIFIPDTIEVDEMDVTHAPAP